MIHCIRLNAAGVGFTAYLADGDRLSTFGLGSAPPGIPRPLQESFKEAQARIDELVATRSVWGMAFSCPPSGATVAVGYGGRVDAPDDKGRVGLRFVHVVLVPREEVVETTQSVLRALTGPGIAELVAGVAAAAQGTEQPEAVVRAAQGALERERRIFPHVPSTAAAPDPLRCVVHDSAGAAPLAWMVLAAQQAHQPGPWQVFDTVQADGLVATLVSPSEGRSLAASELMAETIARRTDTPTSPPASNHAVSTNEPGEGSRTHELPSAVVEVRQPAAPGVLRQALLMVGSNLLALITVGMLVAILVGVGTAPDALLFAALAVASIAVVVFAPLVHERPSGRKGLGTLAVVSSRRRATGYLGIALLGLGCLGGWALSVRTDASGALTNAFRGWNAGFRHHESVPTVVLPQQRGVAFSALADTLARIWTVRDSNLKITRDSLAMVISERDTARARSRVLADTLALVSQAHRAAARQLSELQVRAEELQRQRDTARARLARLRS